MILYPAIDLKDGACVRLLRGDMDAATVFGTDPAAALRRMMSVMGVVTLLIPRPGSAGRRTGRPPPREHRRAPAPG